MENRQSYRDSVRIFARKSKSVTVQRLRLIAEVLRRTTTTSLSGSAGTRQESIQWDLTPGESTKLFLHAKKAGMCNIETHGKSQSVVFGCLENLLAVFDKDAQFFMKFG